MTAQEKMDISRINDVFLNIYLITHLKITDIGNRLCFKIHPPKVKKKIYVADFSQTMEMRNSA